MDRREFLRTGVASAVGVGALSTAGCSQLPVPNPLGGGGGAYTNWLYAPGEIDTNHYSVRVLKPSTVIENDDAFGDNADAVENRVDSRLGSTGVDADQIELSVSTTASNVFTGDYTPDDVGSELEDNDFDDDTDVNGYTIYTANDDSIAWAVGSDALINTTGAAGDGASEIAELTIQTTNGEADRYVDEVEAMSTLTGALDDGFRVFTQTYDEGSGFSNQDAFDNSTGLGLSATRNGDTANLKVAIAYEDGDDVDTGELEDLVQDSDSGVFGNVDEDEASYNKNGKAGVISGQVDADEAALFN